MERVGRWLRAHGEAIYGCGGEWQSPFGGGLAPWRTTRKGNTLYLHLLHYPGERFGIANLHDYWLESAEILDTGAKLGLVHEPTRDLLTGLPRRAPDDIATVLKIAVRNKTEAEKRERRTIALADPDAALRPAAAPKR